MQGMGKIRILFIAGFGPIVRDIDSSRKLYVQALDIPFKEESNGYLHTDALQGAKEFALWPLSQAAESCFGNSTWPDSLPAPHAWLEFDVDSVDRLARNLDDLRRIVLGLTERGVHIVFAKENLTFTSEDSPMSTLLLGVMGRLLSSREN